MDATKPWYLSRTVWASLVTVAVAMVGLLGHSTTDVDQSAITDAILQGVIAIAGIVAVVGRIGATHMLGVGPQNPAPSDPA